MPGWELKKGKLNTDRFNEEEYWRLFNYFFSDSCKKRNTYKFGIIKSILDNLFNIKIHFDKLYIRYYDLFSKFTENYWNLVVKYNIKQMRSDGKSTLSKVETIILDSVKDNIILSGINFNSIDESKKLFIINKIISECKKYVLGALYTDFEGKLFGFDLVEDYIVLNKSAYDFLFKFKIEIEKLNYYAWAKFLNKINNDDVLIRLLDKLELSTPRRNDLSKYREILKNEFKNCKCFYCGKEIKKTIHVDHFIPWSFSKEDKIWNFVLTCPKCNERKSNKLPNREFIVKIEKRNRLIKKNKSKLVQEDFSNYSEELLEKMWQYAKVSGLREMNF